MTNATDPSLSNGASGYEQPAKAREYWTRMMWSLAVAALLVLGAGYEHMREVRHDVSAIDTTGIITDKWSSERHRIRRRSRRTDYNVRLEFKDADNITRSYHETLSKQQWDAISTGQKVSVWYVPSDPSSHSMGSRGYPSARTFLDFLAAFFLVHAALDAYRHMKARERQPTHRWPKPNLNSPPGY